MNDTNKWRGEGGGKKLRMDGRRAIGENNFAKK